MFEKELEEKARDYIDRCTKSAGFVILPEQLKQDFIDLYVAGARENQLQWHKVADGDLPDNCRYVWTNVGAGYHDNDGWWDDCGRLQNVIAWCEPKFEE